MTTAATWNPKIVDHESHEAHAASIRTQRGPYAKTIYEPNAGDTLESYKGDIVNGIKSLIPQLAKAGIDVTKMEPFISFELPDDSLLTEYKELIIKTLTEVDGMNMLPVILLSRYGKKNAATSCATASLVVEDTVSSCCAVTVGKTAPY